MSQNSAKFFPVLDDELGVLDEPEFQYLRSAIWEVAGISLATTKKDLIQSRLRPRLKALGFREFSEYCSLLRRLSSGDPEWQEFTNCLTTNKTDWFREPAHFDYLVNEFIPQWKTEARKKEFRVWSAACSTGEEPYTLAIILQEVLGTTTPYEISATDIDTDVLAKAKKGIYLTSALPQVAERYHKRAFIRGTEEISHLMKVQPALKERVTFRQWNLTKTPFPWKGEFDAIFCRNVFIYFSKEVIASVLDGLYQSAAPNAVLFIGHSESIQGLSKWKYVAPSIYVKAD